MAGLTRGRWLPLAQKAWRKTMFSSAGGKARPRAAPRPIVAMTL